MTSFGGEMPSRDSAAQRNWEEELAWPANNRPPYPPLGKRVLHAALLHVTVIRPREGFAFQELWRHLAPPIPPATSCAASARPLPNNNPAPSCRHPPRTSACSPVRGKNLRDNAFRARTRERTSTRSAIWP